MEIIKSLKRDVNKRGSLTKLKLDLSKPTIKNVDKIISYMAKDLKVFDLENTDPSEYLNFRNFQVDIEKVYDLSLRDRISRKYTKEDVPIYELTLTNMKENTLQIYILPSVKVPDKNRQYEYMIPTSVDRKKILDISYVYGLLKTLDVVYDEITQKEQFFLSEEFENISLYKKIYSEKEVNELLDITFKTNASLLCLRGMDSDLYLDTLRLIVDVIAVMQNLDLNIELTDKYNRDTNSECARAFETKKNIPEKILTVMNNTKFLKDYSYVEIDEGIDLSKFHSIEKEWMKIKKALSLEQYLNIIKPELRFRKLGKHREVGLYYPGLKCICIDISAPSSLIHELGHFIDYTCKEGQLSLQLEFYPLISEYQKAYNKYLIENEDNANVDYLTKKKKYFFTPTEIFARCLEIYLVNKGVKTSFLKGIDELVINRGFPEITYTFKRLINKYYDKLITLDLEVIEEKEVIIKNTIISKLDYIEPIVSSSGQFTFAI